MNEYDSERVAGLLRENRWELTSDETEADLILVNTCAIREKARTKVFSKLGELRLLKTRKPELVIGVMGCMAPASPERHPAPARRRWILVFGSPRSPAWPSWSTASDGSAGGARDGEGPLVKITTRPPAADVSGNS